MGFIYISVCVSVCICKNVYGPHNIKIQLTIYNSESENFFMQMPSNSYDFPCKENMPCINYSRVYKTTPDL